MESLGEKYNVETPICTALINIACAVLSRDLRAEGRTIERLGEDMLERILQDSAGGIDGLKEVEGIYA